MDLVPDLADTEEEMSDEQMSAAVEVERPAQKQLAAVPVNTWPQVTQASRPEGGNILLQCHLIKLSSFICKFLTCFKNCDSNHYYCL